MVKRIDTRIAQKFAIATGVLMTRLFETPPDRNERRLMFAAGPALEGTSPSVQASHPEFDVVGLGFRPGKESKGPTRIFVEETRGGAFRSWVHCRLWAANDLPEPLYIATEDPDVCFSYDGYSLVPTSGRLWDLEEGARRAMARLRAAARLVPDDIQRYTMM